MSDQVVYPAIPDPTLDPVQQRETLLAMKEILETMLGRRGEPKQQAATIDDLTDTGLISNDQAQRLIDRKR